MRMVRLVPQLSVAVGALKFHTLPHSTVLFGAQFTTGTVVSTTVTTCVQVRRLVQESKISQVRVAMEPQAPVRLVTVVSARIVTLVPRQLSKAVGTSKLHTLPHSTVLFVAQVTTGGAVSTTLMVCTQVLRLPHGSNSSHVRVVV